MIHSNRLTLITAALLSLLLGGCGVSSHHKSGNHVRILSVNDMHAGIERMPRFAFIVDSLRREYPELLVLSGGDNQTGNPFNDQYDPKGWPMIDMMNRIGFAATAVGNHEFDTGREGFSYLVSHATFPFLCANMEPTADLPILPRMTLRTKNGYTIGIISLLFINELGIPDSHPDKVRPFTFHEPMESYERHLGMRDSVDVLLFLNHYGIRHDQALAKALPTGVVDLIIGGHSHTKIDKELYENGILITQAGSKLHYCTLTDLTLGPDRRVIARSSRLIPIEEGGSEQPAMRALVDRYYANPEMHKSLATTETGLISKEELGYLMTDAFREVTDADFAITNPGGIRVDSIAPGSISMLDVYMLDPFSNQMMTVELTPAELLRLFESGYDQLDNRRPIVPSGLHVTYALRADGTLEGITLLDDADQPLDPDRTYKVALSSFAASVYSYGDKSRVRDEHRTTEEAIIDYLSRHRVTPDYSEEHRITLFTVEE